MPVETPADRAAMLADFGTAAIYTPAAGSPVEITGVLMEPARLVMVDPGIADSGPSLVVATADLPAGAAVDDSIDIGTDTWRVAVLDHDGTGMTTIRLELD